MELMGFLYRVMGEMVNAGVPVVFKGAMILNLAVRDNNPSKVERATRDIDGDWIGEFPTMEEMKKALQDAVKKIDPSLDVRINRVFGEKKSAGFRIINEKDEKIASIDLSVRQNRFCRPYISYVDGVSIEGARACLKIHSRHLHAPLCGIFGPNSLNVAHYAAFIWAKSPTKWNAQLPESNFQTRSSISKMLSDKIYAISGGNVCRRIKDVLDIYVISFITKINIDELYQIWEETGRKLGNFAEFKTQFFELKEAYDKLKGIKNKPEFMEVYNRVSDVIDGFSVN